MRFFVPAIAGNKLKAAVELMLDTVFCISF